jgi:ClpP class serine protease
VLASLSPSYAASAIAHALEEFAKEKPVAVAMGELAASAGYAARASERANEASAKQG